MLDWDAPARSTPLAASVEHPLHPRREVGIAPRRDHPADAPPRFDGAFSAPAAPSHDGGPQPNSTFLTNALRKTPSGSRGSLSVMRLIAYQSCSSIPWQDAIEISVSSGLRRRTQIG